MNFSNHLMNGCDKKDATSFSKQNNNFIEKLLMKWHTRLAWEYCRKSSTFIVSVSCFLIMEVQTGIPSIPVNKKENLSVPAFSESLKRYNYEDKSNQELIGKI